MGKATTYLHIRFKLFNRAFRDNSMHPIIGYILCGGIFLVLSNLLFALLPDYAHYVYACTALSIVLEQSNVSKNDFLKSCYNLTTYFKIRLLENIIYSLPFILFLIYEGQYLISLILLLSSLILVYIVNRNMIRFTIPTPFGKHPFEFCVGFRITFPILLLSYFTVAIALVYDNFNLGIGAIIFSFFIMMSYYSNPDNEYYIWIHNSTPSKFLIGKALIAYKQSTTIVAPMLIALAIYDPTKIWLLLLILLICLLYLTSAILVKYSYRDQSDISMSIAFFTIMVFPPVITIPIYYQKSISNLNFYLNDTNRSS